MQTKSRAGDEQKDCLHGLQEGASILDSQFNVAPVKITTGNNKISDYLASDQGEYEYQNMIISFYNAPFSVYDSSNSNKSAEFQHYISP